MRCSTGRKESPLQWFAIDLISKKKLFPRRFAGSMKDYLFSFIRESQPLVVKKKLTVEKKTIW